MPTRRKLLAGALAAAVAPRVAWAEVGDPRFVTAALGADGRFRLCGLTAAGAIAFEQNMPGRGHAAASHPVIAEAVVFARRPGTFALVLNCATGQVVAELTAPPSRHFYGHGAYSRDGALLYTTENDLETLEGRIGIWDTRQYLRVGEIASGGIGPHDMRRMPGTDTLVVANGGIATHPDSGRAKLNLPTMRANLAYVSATDGILDLVEVPVEMQLNSLRHLDVGSDGLVAAAFQWQGDAVDAPPLLALHRRGAPLEFLEADPLTHRRLDGYAGSVAFSGDGARVAITSPRGGLLQSFTIDGHRPSMTLSAEDICGVAPGGPGFMYTTGLGHVGWTDTDDKIAHDGLQFDNHLIALRG
ncbi:MAG: DUF1513 domain-containing protein [Pseudomonadota bacterium]